MLLKQQPGKIGRADISDLDADPMMRIQVVCPCAVECSSPTFVLCCFIVRFG
jgi:hypothetical protein